MALSIVTNTASLNAQRQLNKTQNALGSNLARLSSGLRVNSAADDAAGLAISEKFKAQIRGLAQAERNSMDAISLIQTADGALNEISGLLLRMRELSVQSANGTLGSQERGFLDDEFGKLTDEIDRIALVTEFNGQNLLDGSLSGVGGMVFQVGYDNSSNDQITVTIGMMYTSQLGSTSDPADQIADIDLTTVTGAQHAMGVLDLAIDQISSNRAGIGATQNRLQTTITNLASTRENLAAANSRIRDVDVASETAALTRNSILQQAGVSVLAQANQAPQIALALL